jgi:hypothetical protein
MTPPEVDSRLPTRVHCSARSLHVCRLGRRNYLTDPKPRTRAVVNVIPTPCIPAIGGPTPLETSPEFASKLQNPIQNA